MTKTNNVLDYVEIHSGSEHLLFDKYSMTMTFVLVTMLYGFGIPILFPITLAALCMCYFVDKLVIFFYHRSPPMYDDTLNMNSVYYLKWGALMYLASAYWMMSNK